VKKNHPLIFCSGDTVRLKLTAPVVTQMIACCQNTAAKPEAGGILLGRHLFDCTDVVVDKITKPMKGDKQSRFRFFRDAYRHQQVINTAWRDSEGTCNYLGEWHTHPEPEPTPSSIDLLNWRRRLLFDKFDSDGLFFVIVGTRIISVWHGSKTWLHIQQMTCVSSDEIGYKVA